MHEGDQWHRLDDMLAGRSRFQLLCLFPTVQSGCEAKVIRCMRRWFWRLNAAKKLHLFCSVDGTSIVI